MIVQDGICYPDAPARHVKIVSARNAGDRLVEVCFDDGSRRLFDSRSLEGEVFAPLEDPALFAGWKLDYETLTWNDGDIDIAPEYVLNHSVPLPAGKGAR